MGNARDTGYLQNIVTYDANDNIVLPADLSIGGSGGFYWDNTNKRLGIGTATPRSTADVNGILTVGGSSVPALNIYRNVVIGSFFTFARLNFGARYDDTNYATGTNISSVSEGVWSNSNYGSNLFFSTTAQNSTTLTERWRITSAGILQSNGAQTIQSSTGNLTLATAAADGNIILSPNGVGVVQFQNAGFTRARISVESTDNVIFTATSGGGAGLLFWGAGGTSPLITPLKEGLSVDGEVDLGRSVGRFKDLYLSGNITAATATFSSSVGIGISPTNGKLHIVTPAGADFQNAINLEKAGGYGNVFLQSYYVDVPNYGLGIRVGNTTRMVVNGAGNVGIGTDSPVDKLEIYAGTYNKIRTFFEGSYTSGFKFSDYNGGIRYDAAVDRLILFGNYPNVGNITFETAGSEKVRILPTGGITFNGDTAAANALDDYEEGTWTPEISFNTGTTGITYSVRQGSYTKIGNQIHVSGYILLTNKGSSTGTAFINNLPFTCLNFNGAYSAVSFRYGGITTSGTLIAITEINTTRIEMTEVNTSGTITAVTNSDFSNNASIIFSLTYKS